MITTVNLDGSSGGEPPTAVCPTGTWAVMDHQAEGSFIEQAVAPALFLRSPVKPCMRFSRTRLTDTVHR